MAAEINDLDVATATTASRPCLFVTATRTAPMEKTKQRLNVVRLGLLSSYNCCWPNAGLMLGHRTDTLCLKPDYTSVQSQKKVSAHFTNKQILPFGFADHGQFGRYCLLALQSSVVVSTLCLVADQITISVMKWVFKQLFFECLIAN